MFASIAAIMFQLAQSLFHVVYHFRNVSAQQAEFNPDVFFSDT